MEVKPRELDNHDVLSISNSRLQNIEVQALFSFWSKRGGGKETDEELLALVPDSKYDKAAELLLRIHTCVYQAGIYAGRMEERAEQHAHFLFERQTKERDRRRKDGT